MKSNFNFFHGPFVYTSVNVPKCRLLRQELANVQNWGGKVLVVSCCSLDGLERCDVFFVPGISWGDIGLTKGFQGESD